MACRVVSADSTAVRSAVNIRQPYLQKSTFLALLSLATPVKVFCFQAGKVTPVVPICGVSAKKSREYMNRYIRKCGLNLLANGHQLRRR